MKKNHLEMGLKGRVLWELLNSSGETIQHGEQDNLILNSGLDAFAQNNGSTFSGFRSYLALGTGSTAPAVSQTALTAETGSRSILNDGFSSEETQTLTSDVPDDKFVWETRIVRTVTIATAVNLTEFGFSANNSGTLSIRELFRDGANNPITISAQPGNIIKITHILQVRIPLNPATLNLVIAGANGGTHAVSATFFHNGTLTSQSGMMSVFSPASTNISFVDVGNTTSTANNTGLVIGAGAYRSGQCTLLGYTNGSYSRTKRCFFTPAQNNTAHGGWVMFDATTNQAGFKMIKTSGTYTKQATDTLNINLTVSWARSP
jgi:hypothetical protein